MSLVVRSTRLAARCAVCHDEPGEAALVDCARCGAALHDECWSWLAGRCPTLGCARRPAAIRLALTPRPRAIPWERVSWALALAVFVGLVALALFCLELATAPPPPLVFDVF